MVISDHFRSGAAIGARFVLACGVAGAASVSHARAAGSPRDLFLDPNDPVLQAQRDALIEDTLNGMPFGIDIDGMTSGKGMYGGNYGPSIVADELERLIKLLGFSAEQAAAARQLYQQRLTNYAEKAKPLLTAAAAMIGSSMRVHRGGRESEHDVNTPFLVAAKNLEAERILMRLGVLEDLRSLLTPAQEPNWPKMEAAARLLRFMRLESVVAASGVRVDVRALVERTLALPGTEAPSPSNRELIDAILEEYSLASDAIVRRACSLDDEIRANAEQGQPTRELWTAQAKLGIEMAEKVEQFRGASETLVRKITDLVSEPTANRLWLLYHRELFPRIYGELHSERVLDAALKMPDLSGPQREELAAAQTSHLAKLATLRPKAARHEVEEEELNLQLRKAKGEEAKSKVLDRLSELARVDYQAEMKNADYTMVKRVRGTLTAEQRAKLPKRAKPVMPALETLKEEAANGAGG